MSLSSSVCSKKIYKFLIGASRQPTVSDRTPTKWYITGSVVVINEVINNSNVTKMQPCLINNRAHVFHLINMMTCDDGVGFHAE